MNAGRAIDLNADLGEGGTRDVWLLPLLSSANIACGGHAGDAQTMRLTVAACMQAGVAVGAHPGYEDPGNFGRRMLVMPAADVLEMVARQVGRLAAVAADAGARVRHVKPHGALYHQADLDPALAAAVAEAAARVLPGCGFFVPPDGALAAAGRQAGLRVVAEGFADRRYAADGQLVARSEPASVIEGIDDAVAQAMEIACGRRVRTADGSFRPLPAETLCVHGDNPQALEILQAVRQALLRAGLAILPPGQPG
jgi:5-oxoprolinase (ATP-hydrolysing) subunit A